MARINFLKHIKTGDQWVTNGRWSPSPEKGNDNYDWKSLPEGRYFIEWYERGNAAVPPPA